MKTAICCIAKDEDNYINEWIDYHFKLGFDDIYIYQNNWRYKGNKGIKIEWDGEGQQMIAYNHFIKTHGNDYEWVAFLDVDEFLVLKKSLKDFLMDYSEYQAIGINWVLFGDNGLKEPDGRGVLERFTKRQICTNRHIKTILKPDTPNIQMVYPHSCNIPTISPDGLLLINTPFNYNGDEAIAHINHYFCKTYPEFLKKIERGRSDTAEQEKHRYPLTMFDEYNQNEMEDLAALEFYKQ